MEPSRAMRYQTYLLSCWQEQDENEGKSSWRFRLEIPRTGEQHLLSNLEEVFAVIEHELRNDNKEKNP